LGVKIQPCFKHAFSHCQCSRFCPNLPKTAKIYPKTICLRNFEIPSKIEILAFFKIKSSMCRRGTRACAYRLDFQYKNFSFVFFVVKNRPLYATFSIPLVEIDVFLKVPHLLIGMNFCEHVLDSLRNKNLKKITPNLLGKMVFLASKTL
jgi:hypothetical protein